MLLLQLQSYFEGNEASSAFHPVKLKLNINTIIFCSVEVSDSESNNNRDVNFGSD